MAVKNVDRREQLVGVIGALRTFTNDDYTPNLDKQAFHLNWVIENGITTGNGWLLYYGLLMTISAVGDLFILLAVRSLEPNRLVFDHPKRIGCWVLDETPEESAKSTSPTL